jgi:polysaccharide biosynthesis/export protein
MYNGIPYFGVLWLALAGLAVEGRAQVIQNPANPAPPQLPVESTQVRPTYVLGPNDQMMIRANDVDELNEKVFRVEQDGTMTLPLIGEIKAAGRTVQQLEADIAEKLKTLVRNPQVNITVTQFRKDVVLFVGAFTRQGFLELEGSQTLVEMLTKAGLQASASRYIRLTRRQEAGPIPLPGAVQDPVTKVSTVDISLGSLTDTVNPAQDVVLEPNDIITATKAEKVYVEGGFNKVGTLDLDERESLSVMQVITMSGGLVADARADKAQILRPVLNTARRAVIPIDLKRVMSTEANDYPLLPNDVLYVPVNKSHLKNLGRVLQVAGPIAVGVIFYILSRY